MELTKNKIEAISVSMATGLPIDNCNMVVAPNSIAGSKKMIGKMGFLLNSVFIIEVLFSEES
jgi:hypothetical protein